MHGLHSTQLALCAAAFDAASNGLLVLDHEERIVLWNEWMSHHSGLSPQKVMGRTLTELFPELQGSRLLMALRGALHSGHPSLLSQSLNKAPLPLFSGPSPTPQQLRIRQAVKVLPLTPDGMPRHCLIQVTDVSLSVARERLLREQAMELRACSHLDSLTSIPNRRQLDEYLARELRRAVRASAPLSLIMLDIDYFKHYNDTYGHQMGDQSLIQVAAALESTLKRPGDMVTRYGGEEFVVVLVDTDKAGAAVLAEKMRARIESLSIKHEQSQVAPHITISLGVASAIPGLNCEASTLILAADQALYQAKHNGRNRVQIYDPELLCGIRNQPNFRALQA
ncbi:MAG: diguanylate cyclase [Pseudomonadota bacterium]